MIDKAKAAVIHKNLIDNLKAFAESNGFSVSPFTMTFTEDGFKFTCQMGDTSMIGDADPVFTQNLKRFGNWYDLSIADQGKMFTYGPSEVKFEGMKNKNTVIYRKADGKLYRTDAVKFSKIIGRKPME